MTGCISENYYLKAQNTDHTLKTLKKLAYAVAFCPALGLSSQATLETMNTCTELTLIIPSSPY